MKMKSLLGFGLLAISFAAAGLSQAPAPAAGGDDPALTALIDDLARQQAAVVENQAQIDAKLGLIAEDLRVARIYVGRGGGKASAK